MEEMKVAMTCQMRGYLFFPGLRGGTKAELPLGVTDRIFSLKDRELDLDDGEEIVSGHDHTWSRSLQGFLMFDSLDKLV